MEWRADGVLPPANPDGFPANDVDLLIAIEGVLKSGCTGSVRGDTAGLIVSPWVEGGAASRRPGEDRREAGTFSSRFVFLLQSRSRYQST